MRFASCTRLALTAAVLMLPAAARAATEIGHWSFESCSLLDQSGAGHDLTMTGGVTCEPNGRFGEAMTLNGTDGALFWESGNDFAPGNRSWTVAAWVKTPADTAFQGVVTWYRCGADPLCNTGDGALYALSVMGGFAVWNVRDDALADSVVTSSAIVADGQWHFLVGALDRDAGMIRVYVDGAPDGAKPMTAAALSDDFGVPLSIGRWFRRGWGSPGQFLNGSVDEVRVYDGLLSDADILSLYQNNVVTPVAPVTWGTIKALFR